MGNNISLKHNISWEIFVNTEFFYEVTNPQQK